MYELADYPIRLGKDINFTNYDIDPKDRSANMDNSIDVAPSITLIELLYWVFWELSFLGSPEKRDKEKNELKRRVEDLKSGKLKTIPWETVKRRMERRMFFRKVRRACYGWLRRLWEK
jgi:hypothetical protein